MVPGHGFRKRDEGEPELEGVKGILETGDRRVCMQKTNTVCAGSKVGPRGSAAERERAGGSRRGGQGRLRQGSSSWALWAEGSNYGEWLEGTYGDGRDQSRSTL